MSQRALVRPRVLRQELADGLFEGEVGHGMLDALQRLARDRVEARLVWGLGLGLGLGLRCQG